MTAFIAGTHDGWLAVGGQLLASGVLLLSGLQDLGLRARIGAAFVFFMAVAFGLSALHTAVRADIRYGVVICAVTLVFEACLTLRWWIKRAQP